MNIAIVGSNGYVGSALYKALLHSKRYTVTGITRENHEKYASQTHDILINCAMPSGRFWAKNNPEKDFEETVEKTARLLYRWKFEKFVQISSVSARCQLDTVYGRHKASAENLCHFGNNLIIRLGALYSGTMKKGVLLDMIEGKKVFVDGSSRYSFVSLERSVNWIVENLHRTGVVEFGGKNAIALRSVAEHIGTKVEFVGGLDHQDLEYVEDSFPEARDVLAFLDTMNSLESPFSN